MARTAGLHLARDGGVEPAAFAAEAAERQDERHVGDDVDNLAVHGGGLVGEVVVKGLARGCETEQHDDHHPGDQHQHRRHPWADGPDQRNCDSGWSAGRQSTF
jgi:hypothetical protein